MKIPEGWKPYEFGKTVVFNPKVQLQRGEQYSFIEMDDVNPANKYVYGKEKRVYTSGSCSKFKDKDVLFARITPCLDNKKIATAYIEENQTGFGSTEFFILRERVGVTIQEYVHYLSKSEYIIQNAINSFVGASGRQRADAKFIKNIIVPLPKIPEQQRIASILSAYDDLIEVNNKRITLLEQMAEQIYKEWFVRMRFPGYENAAFEKGVPKGWEIKKLSDILKLSYGKSLLDEKRDGGEFPVYGSSGVVGFHSKALVKGPGIVVGRKGNVGSVFYCYRNFYAIDTVYYVETKFSLVYIFHLLNTMHFIDGDAAVPGLNRDQAYSNKFFFPGNNLIEKFHNLIFPIFEQIRNLQEQVILLKQTRDLLLPRLISGKLRVREFVYQERKLS